MKKLITHLLLIWFLIVYLLNSCTPHLMESFRHFDAAIDTIPAIFRIVSLSSIVFIPLILLYEDKKSLRLNSYFSLTATLIALLFSHSYFAIAKTTAFDIISYTLYNLTLIGYSIFFIVKADKKDLKFNPNDTLFLLAVLILIVPLNIFMHSESMLNNNKFIYKNFGLFYFIFMLIFVITSIILTKYLKHKENREIILFFLSIVLVYHIFTRFSYVRLYDYQNSHGIVGALPFYICSFGIMLLPIAIYSKNHFLQSLAFLINTPGAIIVLVNPTAGIVSIFHYDIVYFFFSHILLFAVTLQLAIYLNGKPEKKSLLQAGAFLACYFAVMTVLNIIAESLCDNYNPNFSFVAIAPLPVDVKIFGQFKVWKSTFTPVYIIILWIIHWALAFVTYLIYNSVDKIVQNKKLKASA